MSNEDNNPYQTPSADLSGARSELSDDFSFTGIRKLNAGRGFSWVKEGFSLFMKYPLIWLLVSLVYCLIIFPLALIPFVNIIAPYLLYPIFIAGIMLGCLAIDQNEPLRVGHLFSAFGKPQTGNLVLVGLTFLGLLIATVFIVAIFFGGIGFLSGAIENFENLMSSPLTVVLFMLVFLALIVPLAMLIWFAPALIILNDKKVFEAMKTSFVGCLKNMLPFLLYGISIFVLYFVCMIIFSVFTGIFSFLGPFAAMAIAFILFIPFLFVFISILNCAMYVSYKDIFTSRVENEIV